MIWEWTRSQSKEWRKLVPRMWASEGFCRALYTVSCWAVDCLWTRPRHLPWALRGAFTGCDGFARLMPEISMQMGCWTVWGWLKRFKYRVTCLIRNRRQLGNRKNNMTQRWVLHSLWETTQAWVSAEESLSNGTGYLLRVKLSAVNRLKCIMHVLFFSSCCIYPSISRTHF